MERPCWAGSSTTWCRSADPHGGYDVFHFLHDPDDPHAVWAIGVARTQNTASPEHLSILHSTDGGDTWQEAHTIATPDAAQWNTYNAQINKLDPSSPDFAMFNGAPYRSMYIDRFRNIIIAWRPGPMILRNGASAFKKVSFNWVSENYAELCPFWNITEDDNGLMIISEYSPVEYSQFPHKIWLSTDQQRETWQELVIGRIPPPPTGCRTSLATSPASLSSARVPHQLVDPNTHHLLGDWNCVGRTVSSRTEADCGYYVAHVNRSEGWSTEVLREWSKSALLANGLSPESLPDSSDARFPNGPCFITWWPDGRALITSDTVLDDVNPLGGGWWWGTGGPDPADWGGDRFSPVIDLKNVDPAAERWQCPWMGVAVRGAEAGEVYCVTANDASSDAFPKNKEILFRISGRGPYTPPSWRNYQQRHEVRHASLAVGLAA